MAHVLDSHEDIEPVIDAAREMHHFHSPTALLGADSTYANQGLDYNVDNIPETRPELMKHVPLGKHPRVHSDVHIETIDSETTTTTTTAPTKEAVEASNKTFGSVTSGVSLPKEEILTKVDEEHSISNGGNVNIATEENKDVLLEKLHKIASLQEEQSEEYQELQKRLANLEAKQKQEKKETRASRQFHGKVVQTHEHRPSTIAELSRASTTTGSAPQQNIESVAIPVQAHPHQKSSNATGPHSTPACCAKKADEFTQFNIDDRLTLEGEKAAKTGPKRLPFYKNIPAINSSIVAFLLFIVMCILLAYRSIPMNGVRVACIIMAVFCSFVMGTYSVKYFLRGKGREFRIGSKVVDFTLTIAVVFVLFLMTMVIGFSLHSWTKGKGVFDAMRIAWLMIGTAIVLTSVDIALKVYETISELRTNYEHV